MLRNAKKSWGRDAAHRLWQLVAAERQIIVRSHGVVRHVRVSRTVHLAVCAALVASLGWVGYASVAYFGLRDAVERRDAEIVQRDQAYRQLTQEMGETRRHFLAMAGALERDHVRLVEVVGKSRALRGDLDKLRGKTRSADHEQPKSKPQRDDGSREISRIETRFDRIRRSQQTLVAHLARATRGSVARIEETIAEAGLSLERIISRTPALHTAQGGPFIPVGGGPARPFDRGLASLSGNLDELEALQDVVRHLPLVSPVERYYVASPFGRRRDPFNNRWAMHYGLDLAGPSGQTIRSPGVGTVVHAGRYGQFGYFVEIDHGFGIHTRYGHLRRTLVKRGQKVGFHDPIGILGTSGRSTGPHVHYEIMVDGEQVDPSSFLNAGRHVYQG